LGLIVRHFRLFSVVVKVRERTVLGVYMQEIDDDVAMTIVDPGNC
jgi:hypothetical protein